MGRRIFLACAPRGCRAGRQLTLWGSGSRKKGEFPLLTFWFSNFYSSQAFSSWDDVTHFRVGFLSSINNAPVDRPRSMPLSPR